MRRFACLAAMLLAHALPAAGAEPARIVQQRLPDGSIVLTDRPQPGGRIERSWNVAPDDDAGAAAVRRQAAAQEAAAVSARIARQLERQRELDAEVELARQRVALAQAEREAARARADADALPRSVVIARPPRLHPPPPRPEIRPPPRRPGPVPVPRPGATPPPGTLAAIDRD